jgi:hypothetical protein
MNMLAVQEQTEPDSPGEEPTTATAAPPLRPPTIKSILAATPDDPEWSPTMRSVQEAITHLSSEDRRAISELADGRRGFEELALRLTEPPTTGALMRLGRAMLGLIDHWRGRRPDR